MSQPTSFTPEADIHYIQGVTDLYQTSQEKGFIEAAQYPLAWEVIFDNNKEGKVMVEDILKTFHEGFPKEKGKLFKLDGEVSDIARCITCIFKDSDAFRQFLKTAMKDKVIVDESEKRIIPSQLLVDKAKQVLQSQKLVLA